MSTGWGVNRCFRVLRTSFGVQHRFRVLNTGLVVKQHFGVLNVVLGAEHRVDGLSTSLGSECWLGCQAAFWGSAHQPGGSSTVWRGLDSSWECWGCASAPHAVLGLEWFLLSLCSLSSSMCTPTGMATGRGGAGKAGSGSLYWHQLCVDTSRPFPVSVSPLQWSACSPHGLPWQGGRNGKECLIPRPCSGMADTLGDAGYQEHLSEYSSGSLGAVGCADKPPPCQLHRGA